MLATLVNLYDKYKLTNWHQLWADDSLAVVLYSTTDKVFPDSPRGRGWIVLTDNGRFTSKQYCTTLSEAMADWNKQINRHLEGKS